MFGGGGGWDGALDQRLRKGRSERMGEYRPVSSRILYLANSSLSQQTVWPWRTLCSSFLLDKLQ